MSAQDSSYKYHVITFGCQMNENDSKQIAGLLIHAQYEPCNSIDEADIIIINTCLRSPKCRK